MRKSFTLLYKTSKLWRNMVSFWSSKENVLRELFSMYLLTILVLIPWQDFKRVLLWNTLAAFAW